MPCPRRRDTPHREQRIGRERDVVLQREPARDVLDVRVQATVLVHDQHHRQRLARLRRLDQIAARGAIAVGRRELEILGLQALVVGLDLLRHRELRRQRGEQAGCRGRTNGEARGAEQESTAIDVAVHVLVEQPQHFRIEVVGGLPGRSRHGAASQVREPGLYPTAAGAGDGSRRNSQERSADRRLSITRPARSRPPP